MILAGNLKSRNFLYDFTQDGTAGSVGTKNLGLHFSTHIQVLGFWIRTLIAPTSAGGLATISFGWVQTSSAAPVMSTGAYMLPNVVGAFVLGFPLVGNILYVAPEEVNFTSDAIMTVGVEPLLTGKLLGTVIYQETDI